MKSAPASITAESLLVTTNWALCCYLVKTDGTIIRATSLDQDLTVAQFPVVADTTFLDGFYPSTTAISGSSIKNTLDLSVPNLDVTGTMTNGITSEDIEAGLYDNARVVVFQVNWKDPTAILVLRDGTVGEISRTHEGSYKSEIRGLTQKLQQIIVRTYGKTCDATLGDGRCTFNLAPVTVSASVGSVIEPHTEFISAALTDLPPWYTFGLVTWLTGLNTGFSKEIKKHVTSGGRIRFVEPMPNIIQAGDTFDIVPGCNKEASTCKDKFDNLVNFRGFPDIPGTDEIVQMP